MNAINKVSLIGLGAIGGTYASKLEKTKGVRLSIIADENRSQRYSKNGFIINSESFKFGCVTPKTKVEPSDLIIISVKFHQLNQALEDIKNHVGPNTIILSLLNGISSERIIRDKFPSNKVLYGVVLSISAVREGNKITYADTAKIHFGEENNSILSQEVKLVKDLFERSNIGYIIPEDMIRTLWWKFMFNVGINQTSAILGAPFEVYKKVKEAENFLRDTMYEVMGLGQKLDIKLDENDIEYFINHVYSLPPNGKTSMLQDIEGKRKTEVEMLAGTICQLGEENNIETPINKMILNIIRSMELMNESK
ncbi:MAG: ketopantoate reductase family protein [Firmicutes bacterium]|nr:ketopantoate reductase family protein [Bacillota bacterium]